MRGESQGEQGNLGCMVLVGALMLFGTALIGASYLVGDTVAHNPSTGRSGPIGGTLFVIGGVFGAIGGVGMLVLVLGRDRSR